MSVSKYLDVLTAHSDVIRTRHALQDGDLEVEVGETHEGAQDGLSLHPRSLGAIREREQTRSVVAQSKGTVPLQWKSISDLTEPLFMILMVSNRNAALQRDVHAAAPDELL